MDQNYNRNTKEEQPALSLIPPGQPQEDKRENE